MGTFSNGLNINSLAGTAVIGTGTGFSTLGYSTTPTASNLVERDANASLSANNLIAGYTTTVTSGINTSLTVASTEQQFFTGTNNQNVRLPSTATLVLGQSFIIVNNSTQVVSLETSIPALIQNMAANTQAIVTVVDTTIDTAAAWNIVYSGSGGAGSISITGDTGAVSGSALTLFANNTAINCGSSVLFANSGTTSTLSVTDSNSNTFIGLGAGTLANSALSCTALGQGACAAISDDTYLVAVGAGAMQLANGSSQSVAVGAISLSSAVTSEANVAVGYGTLASSTASNNTALGYVVLRSSVADIQNTGVGWGALTFLNGGNSNTAMGFQSMNGSLTAANNCAYGLNTLLECLSGTDCCAFGFQALQSSAADVGLVAIGSGALLTCHGCTQTVSIGFQSLASSIADANNTAIGWKALNAVNTGFGNNTALGTNAGFVLETGAYNLLLGSTSGATYSTSESSNILLNHIGVATENNTLRAGLGTGSGAQQLSRAFISGINGVSPLSSTLVYINSSDQLSTSVNLITSPVDSNTATTAFGSLAIGTALQNTLGYDILVNISIAATVATGATIVLGVGPTSTPTTNPVTASFSVGLTQSFTAIVPSGYYCLVNTTGTITVGSITTQVCPI